MSLHLSIVQDKVQDLIDEYGDDQHLAFLKLVHSLIKDCDYEDLDTEDTVDGADEKQINAICIDDDPDNPAKITIIQAKFVDGSPSSAIALSWSMIPTIRTLS